MISENTKRFDVQLLRGIAVMAVLAFHADKELLPKGYLGVDIFFVISGFLITGLIMRQLAIGAFSFRYFYIRRARRLLPASLTTLFVTTALSFILLTPADFEGYANQLTGALTFTANFFLAQQTDYFASKAETKPLLHIWSLSLEEQYYFIAPVLLWLTPLRRHAALIVLTGAASVLLCLIFVNGLAPIGLSTKAQTKFAFFMLPMRAWELLIGSGAALLMIRCKGITLPFTLKYISLIVIALVCIFGVSDLHPGPDAIIVTLATSALLVGQDHWLPVNKFTSLLAKLGDWSYSLYLVHWPLFSFAFIIFLGEPPMWLMAILGLFSVFLGWAQYRFVEQPFLCGNLSKNRTLWKFIIAVSMFLVVAVVIMKNKSITDPDLEVAKGLHVTCDQRGHEYLNLPQCQFGSNPTFMVWGDSYAMHLIPGIRASFGANAAFLQATKSACTPILGISFIDVSHSKMWANDCLSFNKSVFNSLAEMPTVKYVVIASPWIQVLKDGGQTLYRNESIESWSTASQQGLIDTIRALEKLGKHVIIIGPTAMALHDVGTCNTRALYDRPYVRERGCDPTFSEVNTKVGAVIDQLQSAVRQTNATLLLPTDVMCPDGHICPSVVKGKSIYRDTGHLTTHGSIFVVESLRLSKHLGISATSEK